MTQPKTYFYDDIDSQAQSLVDYIALALLEDIKNRGEALLILPGGTSPRALITMLAQNNLPWDKIQITVTDERCVPLEDEHSNIGQLKKLFVEQGSLLHPVALWNDKMLDIGETDMLLWPATVTVLGMGLDGHIASLFPEQDWSCENVKVLNATAPSEPRQRVSLSMEALASSSRLILLVNGDEKWNLYQRIEKSQCLGTPLGNLMDSVGSKLHVHVVAQKTE